MPYKIVIANQKGGVAKTTTVAALASGLTRRGYKVLAVDLDPQGNLSFCSGYKNGKTMYHALTNDKQLRTTVSDIIIETPSYDIAPANIDLAAIEPQMLSATLGATHRLKAVLEDNGLRKYDVIIIDTPPSLGMLTTNALTAADTVIIPATGDAFAATGIKELKNTVQQVQGYTNPSLRINGILLTKYNPRTCMGKSIIELANLLAEDGDPSVKTVVYSTIIRQSVSITEAQANKRDIWEYKPNNTVAVDYDAFAEEFTTINHAKLQKAEVD